uniref:NADH-ubiquinone oxidoreductase chain 6 n=1 Tax=Tetraphalerus bruchi TaxID=546504 RepID=B6D8Z3_TETBR|nr:NADH dehydrogenase subunit 6 [Tetraphalerus bruchi]ACF35131.1 NADH dehydrogenase subunit 6 [Tetraphalerus bruchi]
MSTMMMINLSTNLVFSMMNHPMSMVLMLLLQTITVSMTTGTLTSTFWFSYILFLVMVGGLIVLFIYMTSLASNEMFKIKMNKILSLVMGLSMLILIFSQTGVILEVPFIKQPESNELFSESPLKPEEMMINKIYNKPTNLITMMLINYLLLTLIAVVKITDVNQGPLRQKK